MKPLTTIYCIRVFLGLAIGFLCTVYLYFSASNLGDIYTLLTGISFALLFYVATFYPIKFKFFARIEKPQKLITQGIGIYFFAWIVTWTLMVTLLMSAVSVNIYQGGSLAAGQEFWVVAESGGNIVQNVTTSSGAVKLTLLPPGAYIFKLGNSSGYILWQQQNLTIGWLEYSILEFNITHG